MEKDKREKMSKLSKYHKFKGPLKKSLNRKSGKELKI